MKHTCLIIDDEELARQLTKKFLSETSDFECIAEAQDGFEGIKLIKELKPAVVFLDIQMPKLTGLEMLELLENPPAIVFCTAYDQFAIEAFERNAIDYLLKPFSRDRFVKALAKVSIKLQEPSKVATEIQKLQEQLPSTDRIVVKTGNKIDVIDTEKVLYIESDRDYVWIHTASGKFLKQKTMKALENELSKDFLRVHRSFLVNVAQIDKVELYDKNSHLLKLKNGSKIEVSRDGYKKLKDTLGF